MSKSRASHFPHRGPQRYVFIILPPLLARECLHQQILCEKLTLISFFHTQGNTIACKCWQQTLDFLSFLPFSMFCGRKINNFWISDFTDQSIRNREPVIIIYFILLRATSNGISRIFFLQSFLCRTTYGNDCIPLAKTTGTDRKFSSPSGSEADLHLEKL